MINTRFRELVNLEVEVTWRRALRGITGTSSRVLHVRSRLINKDESLLPEVDQRGEIRDEDWQRYVRRREAEAAAMQPRLVELKDHRDAELAEVTAALERYWIAAPP